ncbi:MAG TPA: FdtA/QdtA family cupin domain-containing protein [Candidatus Binataceae bacterium]|nr:FdtA/QdtA family cupin domain-containing protein [Candidatus Binataceae bacterium]
MMSYRLIELPLRSDKRGNLVFAQQGDHIPFPVKRIFFIYDVPEGATRAGHAHRTQHQCLILLSGSCLVKIDDSARRLQVVLDSPRTALYVPPLTWLDIDGFSAGSICLVLTSDVYDAADYVRDYAEYAHLAAMRRDTSAT